MKRFGFGAMRLPMVNGEVDKEQFNAMIDEFLAAGFTYFELETRGNELWKQLETSGGLAMHIAGEFPGLSLEFWAIRG